MPTASLIDRGVFQGAYIECSRLPVEANSHIQNARAIEKKRGKPLQSPLKLVVLSQNCDIANENDHYIELAVAKPISQSQASLNVQRGRNLRKLHLLVGNEWWEVESELISVIPKDLLFAIENLQVSGTLDETNLDILIQWRVNRYARRPLPDAFNKAIFDYLHTRETGFYDFLTSNRSKVLDVYAFVRPLEDESAGNYDVALTIVLRMDCSEEDVELLSDEFRHHINSIQGSTNCLTMIQAENGLGFHPDATNLNLVSLPRDFSLEDAAVMRRLALDFLCWDEISSHANHPEASPNQGQLETTADP